MGYPTNDLVYNRGRNGQLMEERITAAGNIAYFEGGAGDPGCIECHQWLRAILDDTEPLVKPEQAYVVTEILEAIYKSSDSGSEVKF